MVCTWISVLVWSGWHKSPVFANEAFLLSCLKGGKKHYITLWYIVTYVDSHLHTCTYICRIIHSDTTIKTQEGRRKKTSLEKYSPLTLLQGFERVVQGLHVRGCWRPNKNFIFWPHCYDRHVVSFLFSWCSTRGLGVHCWMLAFFMASYQHLLWTPNSIGGFKPHRPGVAFLTTSRL